MNTNINTTPDEAEQKSIEHTEDGAGALAELAVAPPTPDSVNEVFETVSRNCYSAPMTVLICPQNELASMILSHLPIRDLSRALGVSKRWQQLILGTVELRQNLFLTPKHSAKEYLDYTEGTAKGRGRDIITREYNKAHRSCLIIETHPAMKVQQGRYPNLSLDQPYATLKKAPPSAFLTQPPLTEVDICHRKKRYTVERESGVTFGDVVAKFEELHAMHDRTIFDRGEGAQFLSRFGRFPRDFKVDWDDDNIEQGSGLRQIVDDGGDEEFAKFRLLTSQKYDTLISAVESWYDFVSNSLNSVQAARKAMADS
jgi:hypothetical protein